MERNNCKNGSFSDQVRNYACATQHSGDYSCNDIKIFKRHGAFVYFSIQVKVDIIESDDFPAASRQALFVLYNCARLSKILEKYDSDVSNGKKF